MERKIIGLLAGILALCCSCSNTLDVYTQYKETTIVYGLLNQKDTTHYIKINKAFLGPGNALQIAQVYDSINYANQLTVQLIQVDANGNTVNTFKLIRDSSIAKPPGIFSSPKQILYKTKAALDSSCQYNLVVTNNVTHNRVTGSTSLINGLSVTSPTYENLDFTGTTANPLNINWNSAVNGYIYGVTIRFYYIEEIIATLKDTLKSIDWVFLNQTSLTTTGGEPMNITITNPEFFQFVHGQLQPDPKVRRFLQQGNINHDADIIFSVGGQDLYTYMQVSQPSTSIVQSQPQYTDIKNGFGLFSSRYNYTKTGCYLGQASVDSLYGGQYTSGLFCNPVAGTINYCGP